MKYKYIKIDISNIRGIRKAEKLHSRGYNSFFIRIDLLMFEIPEKQNKMKTRNGAKNDKNVFLHHQIKIAKKTITMPDAILGVLGGMTKDEARKILTENNINF